MKIKMWNKNVEHCQSCGVGVGEVGGGIEIKFGDCLWSKGAIDL